MFASSYNPLLVLSLLFVVILAAYTALDMTGRITTKRGRAARWWLAGGACAMGVGIWSMHFIGMLAFDLPIPLGYDLPYTLLFLLIAIASSAFAVWLVFISVLDMRLASLTAVLASSLAEANRELTYQALHDSLTTLPNRILLEDRLNQAIESTDRRQGHFALLFMDLDNFKAVNDACGRHAGDLLLVEVAQRIRANAHIQDTIARVGGDEFVLLADVDEPTDAAAIADTLSTAIAQPFAVAGHELLVSTSIGIAIYPGNATRADHMLANADAAMHHAKALGSNRYCFFETSMNVNAHETLQLLQDLRAALVRHELVLFYQPQFDARTEQAIGAEALLRWEHPTLGLIAPDQFIPWAEKTGAILSIGEWVLNEACRQMREWQNCGHVHWTIAVNLSSLQFGHAGLIQTVRATLQRHGLAPRYLTLEITESTAMRNVEASLVTLQQLHAMGVKISIDDFGTGYSSLLYLKRLPASELKIDHGFVRDLPHSTEDAAIVSAIVALGHTLKLKVVAEGVETAAQQAFLTHLGCDALQGFFLGRPMRAHQFIEAMLLDSEQRGDARLIAGSRSRDSTGFSDADRLLLSEDF
jgi:diguanylate cyclase